MKKTAIVFLTLLMLLSLSACGGSSAPVSTQKPAPTAEPVPTAEPAQETASAPTPSPKPEAESAGGSGTDEEGRLAIPKLNGSIRLPDGYYAFGEDIDFTDEMCADVKIDPDRLRSVISLLQGQTLIVPAGVPYNDSLHIYLKVKEKSMMISRSRSCRKRTTIRLLQLW